MADKDGRYNQNSKSETISNGVPNLLMGPRSGTRYLGWNNGTEIPDPDIRYFTTNFTYITAGDDFVSKVRKHIEQLYTKIGVSEMKGSGWTLHSIQHIEMFATTSNLHTRFKVISYHH